MKNRERLEKLLEIRRELVKTGEGMAVLELNEKIAELAGKLKLDYYSL